jgi:hypothetical protein
MIFLLEYDRSAGRLINVARFPDALRLEAESSRLSLEIRNLKSGLAHEIVLLEASSEAALRTTHRRYFEALESLTRSPPPGWPSRPPEQLLGAASASRDQWPRAA